MRKFSRKVKKTLAVLLAVGLLMNGSMWVSATDGTEDSSVTAYVETPHAHSYSSSETKTATCEQGGEIVYTCNCGDTYTESTPAKGHSYGEWETVTLPSANQEGLEKRVCSVCQTEETRKIPVTGGESSGTEASLAESSSAVPEESTASEAPGLSQNGQGEAVGNGSGHEHSYAEAGTVVKEPSAQEHGKVAYSCTVEGCGEKAEQENHYYVLQEDGTYSCAVCGKAEQGDSCTHDWKEKEGNLQLQECALCHSLMEKPAAVGNTLPGPEGSSTEQTESAETKTTETESTETESTETESAETETTETETTETESAGKTGNGLSGMNLRVPSKTTPCPEGEHGKPDSSEIKVLTQASCKSGGKIEYTCTKCGQTVTEATPAASHYWNSETGKCVNCGEACSHKDENGGWLYNSSTGKCSVCGMKCTHENADGTSAVDTVTGKCEICGFKECTEHTKPQDTEIETVREAACEQKGLIRYTCNVCGERVEEETDVDPDTHVWNSSTGKCKLCGEECSHKDADGQSAYDADTGTCTICGMACPHTDSKGKSTFTAKDDGKGNTVVMCSLCGYICNHEPEHLQKLSEDDAKAAGDKDATCKEEGQMSFDCQVCGTRVTEVLPELKNHTYSSIGSNDGVCTVCGDNLHNNPEDGDCEHKNYVNWNAGEETQDGNPWVYVKTDLLKQADIYRCGECGSTWERPMAKNLPAKTVDLIQIAQGNLKVTIKVNGQDVGNNESIKIERSDTLNIHIEWALDNDKKPDTNTTIQYQLPGILKADELTDRIIYSNDRTEEYGTYSINSSGLLTFVLNEKLLGKSDISGSFDLTATLKQGEGTDSDKQEILFPGSGAGIILYFKSSMSCAKNGKVNSDGSIDYSVEIKLDADSKNVSLTDTLGSNLTFDGYEGSFRLKDPSGGVTDITDSVSINKEKNQAEIDLGNLKAGTYTLAYQARLISTSITSGNPNKNSVTWKWDDQTSKDPVSWEAKVSDSPLNRVNKTKNAVGTDGSVDWKITLNYTQNTIPIDLAGKTIRDWYEITGGMSSIKTYVAGPVTVKDSKSGLDITDKCKIVARTENEYDNWNYDPNCLVYITFPTDGKYDSTYVISYTTKTEVNGILDGTVPGYVAIKNWAEISGTKYNDYEDAVLGLKNKVASITKKGIAVSNGKRAYTATWQSELDLTKFTDPSLLTELIISDSITKGDGMRFWAGNISELDLTITLSDGTTLERGTDYTLRPWWTSGTKTFQIVFTDIGLGKVAGKKLTMVYTSIADSSAFTGESETFNNKVQAEWFYQNDWKLSDNASVTMYRKNAFNKAGSVSEQKNADGKYEVTWTLLVNTNDADAMVPEQAYEGDMTITDTLPSGLTYKAGTAQYTKSTLNGFSVDKQNMGAITPELSVNENGRSVLTFKLNSSSYNEAYKITFVTEVDPAYLESDNGGTLFKNEAILQNGENKGTAEADVTVAEHDLLKKSGEVKGSRVAYTIHVNANAQKLTQGGTLTLEDAVTSSNATILIDTVEVKTVDAAGQTDITAACSLTSKDGKLVIGNIPDEKHVQITYQAVTTVAGEVAVVNSAVLKGEVELASTVLDKTFVIKADAVAGGRTGTLTVEKRDSSDARVTLEGAQFTLYEYDLKDMDKSPVQVGVFTTDSEGRVTFDSAESADGLLLDVLYCYVETKAPDNYILDNTPHYFMLEGNSFAAQNALAQQRIGAEADYVTYSAEGSRVRTIYNDPYTPPTPPPAPPETPDEPDNPGTTTTTTTTTTTVTVTPRTAVLGETKLPDGPAPALPQMGVLGEIKGPGTGDSASVYVILWTCAASLALAVIMGFTAFSGKKLRMRKRKK